MHGIYVGAGIKLRLVVCTESTLPTSIYYYYYYYYCYYWQGPSIYSPDCAGIHYVDKADLRLTEIHQELGTGNNNFMKNSHDNFFNSRVAEASREQWLWKFISNPNFCLWCEHCWSWWLCVILIQILLCLAKFVTAGLLFSSLTGEFYW